MTIDVLADLHLHLCPTLYLAHYLLSGEDASAMMHFANNRRTSSLAFPRLVCTEQSWGRHF